MRRNGAVMTAVLGMGLGAFVMGCEGEETVPVTPPPQPTAGEVAEPGAAADTPAPGGMLGDLQTSMQQGRQQTEQAVGQAATEAQTQAQAQAGQVSQAVGDQAQQLLDQAVAYVKENKLDLAEQALTKVEQMEGLSPATLERVQQVRGMITSARQGQGALQGLQNLGGGGGTSE